MSFILDYLAVPDLLTMAQTGHRMREMVYDDTRWVKRLQSMGIWDEEEARRGARMGAARTADFSARKTSTVNLAAGPVASTKKCEQGAIRMGLSAVSMSALPGVNDPDATTGVAADALRAISRSRSARGFARQEYGKIYAALNPYYLDILARCSSNEITLTDPLSKGNADRKTVIQPEAKLFQVYNTPEEQAQMLSQLHRFAKSDFSLGGRDRMATIDLVIATFEDTVLRRFEQSMEVNDIDIGMAKYAHVLVNLNGGDSAIERFIGQNLVFQDCLAFGDPSECFKDGVALALGISLQPVQDYFRLLSRNVLEQLNIASRVFPSNEIDSVVQQYVARVATEILAVYISKLINAAQERSLEASVKVMPALFEHCLRFMEAIIQQHGRVREQNFQGKTAKRVFEALVVKVFELHVELYLQKELDFFSHKAKIEVSAWETQLSEDQASAESFFMSNVNRQAAKRDFLSSFRKVVMMPINVVSSAPNAVTSKNSSKSATADIETRPSMSRPSTASPLNRVHSPCQQELPTTELAAKAAIMNSRLEGISSLFSIELALNIVHCAKASIERIAAFVQIGGLLADKVRAQCEAVFVQLLKILGTDHIKSGFDRAVAHLGEYKPRPAETFIGNGNSGSLIASNKSLETSSAVLGMVRDSNYDIKRAHATPLLTFLELVNVGDLIQQMLDVFYSQELIATRLIERDDFLNAATKEKKRFEQMLDERVAAGLNKGIDVLMAEAEIIFATTQQPSDYNPNTVTTIPTENAGGATNTVAIAEESMNVNAKTIDIGPTETARTVVALVSCHTSMLVGSTEKTMLDVFNQEVGLRLYGQLCKHIKRQRISKDGAIKLIRYVLSYLPSLLHVLQAANVASSIS